MILRPSHPPTQLWWCPDCERYFDAHPLDHLVDAHPPQHADGSVALPERIALAS
jgi:hypothetical protein